MPGLLNHSDRGIQYASAALATLLAKSGSAASMSRRGNCYDHARVVFTPMLKLGRGSWLISTTRV